MSDSSFINLMVAFFAMYYAFYVALAQAPIDTKVRSMLVGASLFYSILCMAFVLILFLFLFGSGTVFAKDSVLRAATYSFDTFVFWRLGSMVSSRLRCKELRRWPSLGAAVFGVLAFLIYISIDSFVLAGTAFGRI